MASPDGVWPGCAVHTLEVHADGSLGLTPAYLRHLYLRPELAPIETSCADERSLHRDLLEDPTLAVPDIRIDVLKDPDARENYQLILAFRNFLGCHPNLESAYYSAVASDAAGAVPGPFLDLLAQTILGHLYRSDGDAFDFRAAELFFRSQQASVDRGLLLADSKTLARRRAEATPNPLESLIREARGDSPAAADELDVLNPGNAAHYAERSECYDFALDLARSGPGMAALCECIARWIEHFHGVRTAVTAVEAVDSTDWRWHIGLDRESNAILNALYRGQEVDEVSLTRLIALFRLECLAAGFLDPRIEGRPVFLGLAMDTQRNVRLKPQNLLHNLPLASRS